jgi:hypothetical protein
MTRAPSTHDYGAIRDFRDRQQARRSIVHSTEPTFWEVFEAAVRAHGGHVTSPPNYSEAATIECPIGSNIPDDLRSLNFAVYPMGQTTRIGNYGREHVVEHSTVRGGEYRSFGAIATMNVFEVVDSRLRST